MKDDNATKLEKKINQMLKLQPKIISDWNDMLEISGDTVTTRSRYIYVASEFLDYLKRYEHIKLSNLKTQNVLHFLKHKEKLFEGKMSDSYKVHLWYVLNNFINYLCSVDIVSYNCMNDIPKAKIRDTDKLENKQYLTANDFKKIIEEVKYPARICRYFDDSCITTKARDMAIVLLLMTTGMRKTALTEINMQNLDLENATLSVIDKGRKTHKYYLQEMVIDALQEWLSDREWLLMMTDKETDALFLNQKGDRISGRGIDNLINKYSKHALGKELYPHAIRSGFCSIIYSQTHDIEFVRRAVGHANVATTQRYIVTDKTERKQSADIMAKVLKGGKL